MRSPWFPTSGVNPLCGGPSTRDARNHCFSNDFQRFGPHVTFPGAYFSARLAKTSRFTTFPAAFAETHFNLLPIQNITFHKGFCTFLAKQKNRDPGGDLPRSPGTEAGPKRDRSGTEAELRFHLGKQILFGCCRGGRRDGRDAGGQRERSAKPFPHSDRRERASASCPAGAWQHWFFHVCGGV